MGDSVERIAYHTALGVWGNKYHHEEVRAAVRATIPNRIKQIGQCAHAAARVYGYPTDPYKGKLLFCIIQDMLCVQRTMLPRYSSLHSDTVYAAEAAFPVLRDNRRCGTGWGSRITVDIPPAAANVIAAAKAIGISDDAEVRELATSLGYTGELPVVESGCVAGNAAKGMACLDTAASVAAIFDQLLLSEIESVVGEVSDLASLRV